eukprot:scaffold27.g6029.t1
MDVLVALHVTPLRQTGGIACGKSVVSSFFREQGIPVLDSDEVVHQLYAPGGAAVGPVNELFPFPGVVVDGAINRAELSKHVLGDADALWRLETVVHALVVARQAAFLHEAAGAGHPLVVLDIPLLYEMGAEAGCDAVLVVAAPPEVQRQRALARPGMTTAKLDAILARQWPDRDRRARAEFVIDTGHGSLEETCQQVAALAAALRGRQGTAFEHWRLPANK